MTLNDLNKLVPSWRQLYQRSPRLVNISAFKSFNTNIDTREHENKPLVNKVLKEETKTSLQALHPTNNEVVIIIVPHIYICLCSDLGRAGPSFILRPNWPNSLIQAEQTQSPISNKVSNSRYEGSFTYNHVVKPTANDSDNFLRTLRHAHPKYDPPADSALTQGVLAVP